MRSHGGKKIQVHHLKQWTENRLELMAFLDFPLLMRSMIHTTNPVEALPRIMRKLVKSKAAWVSDPACRLTGTKSHGKERRSDGQQYSGKLWNSTRKGYLEKLAYKRLASSAYGLFCQPLVT